MAKIEIEFTRDSRPEEDSVIHKQGEKLTVNEASAQRWYKRDAAVPVTTKAAEKSDPKPAKTDR